MASISSEEFNQLQAQLLTLKTDLYECKEREIRANKLRDQALEKLQQTEKEKEQLIANHNQTANASFQGVNEDGTMNEAPVASSSSTTSTSERKGSGAFSNLLNSVKRNSQSLGHAIANAAHRDSNATAPGSSTNQAGNSVVEKLEQELASVRAQSANDLDELREQNQALKMNIQHLHKKSVDLEKQNSTLMTHLSNLEEERQSLAEKRERELRKRLAKQEGRVEEGDEDEENEEDLDEARKKWKAKKAAYEEKLSALQTQLTTMQSEMTKKDESLAKCQVQLSDEAKNFERILMKMQEKDEALLKVREELNQKSDALQAMTRAAASNPSASPNPLSSSTPSPLPSNSPTTPSKTQSLRNFFKKDKDKDVPATPTPTPAPAPPVPTTSASPTIQTEDTSSTTNTASVTATDSTTTAAFLPPSSPSSAASIPPWSASQSLEDQITSLQSELASLKQLNEHLITSVQKKDTSIRTIQDDCDRVMAKLAEKEMQIMSLREQNMELQDGMKEVKKKEATINKLQQELQQAKNAPNATVSAAAEHTAAELKAATDAITIVHQEFDQLKEQMENMKDELFLSQTQLLDKQKILSEREESLKELKASTEQLDMTLKNLIQKKDEQEKELQDHIDYLEQKCLSEVHEWEKKYDEDVSHERKLRGEAESLTIKFKEELSQARSSQSALQTELAAIKEQLETKTKSESELTAAHTTLQHRLTELETNASIETRKRNHLVHELKQALKQELIKSKELQARLKNAEDDIITLKVMNQHQIFTTTNSNQTNGVDGQTNGDPNDPNSSAAGGPQSTSQPPFGTQPTPNTNGSSILVSGGQHGKGVEQEVTIALATKLAELQNDKHLLTKQKASLEEHIDLLQNDVLQKKEMIRNLVRRIETGALSSSTSLNTDGGAQKAAMFSQLTPEAKQSLFDKMEIILQETTLQNAQYKMNLQSMGQEITKLLAEAEEQRNEISALKEEIECSKDELEISQSSAADSLTLLRNTETHMKQYERALRDLLTYLDGKGDQYLSHLESETQSAIKQLLSAPKPTISRAPTAPSTPAQPRTNTNSINTPATTTAPVTSSPVATPATSTDSNPTLDPPPTSPTTTVTSPPSNSTAALRHAHLVAVEQRAREAAKAAAAEKRAAEERAAEEERKERERRQVEDARMEAMQAEVAELKRQEETRKHVSLMEELEQADPDEESDEQTSQPAAAAASNSNSPDDEVTGSTSSSVNPKRARSSSELLADLETSGIVEDD